LIIGYADILVRTKRTKFVATRDVSWAQKVTEMLMQPGLCPSPTVGAHSASPDPLA